MKKNVRYVEPIDDFDIDYESMPPPMSMEELERESMHLERAKQVITELYDGLPFPDFDATPEENHKTYTAHVDRLNALIRNNLDAESIWHFAFLANERGASARAGLRAMARHRLDPKQAAKQRVSECWDAWQKKPGLYKSKSAFARDMLDKYETLESQRVIERWCKEWEGSPPKRPLHCL